jgi:hypothetical protein
MKIIETKAYEFELSQEEYLSLKTTINLFKEMSKEDSNLEIFESVFEGVMEVDSFGVLANLLEDGILMRSE